MPLGPRIDLTEQPRASGHRLADFSPILLCMNRGTLDESSTSAAHKDRDAFAILSRASPWKLLKFWDFYSLSKQEMEFRDI